jgi:gamma-glutamylcyclotransferase (GGCT)/AIG2-like uncharacterized protein YtfP
MAMAANADILVFSYGSNMFTPRMRERAPGASVLRAGRVAGRRLAFHKRSVDGSGKGNALWTGQAGDQVWGVIYGLSRREKLLLDGHEYLGVGYDEELVEVVTSAGSLQAWMYTARAEAIDAALSPYCWYHELVLRGALEHRLPSDYIEMLRSVPVVPDPDHARRGRHRRLFLEDAQ